MRVTEVISVRKARPSEALTGRQVETPVESPILHHSWARHVVLLFTLHNVYVISIECRSGSNFATFIPHNTARSPSGDQCNLTLDVSFLMGSMTSFVHCVHIASPQKNIAERLHGCFDSRVTTGVHHPPPSLLRVHSNNRPGSMNPFCTIPGLLVPLLTK